jgi:hypothetical protein
MSNESQKDKCKRCKFYKGTDNYWCTAFAQGRPKILTTPCRIFIPKK